MTRMFKGYRTWNPYFGCKHHCYGDGCIIGNMQVQTRQGKKSAWHVRVGDELMALNGVQIALTKVEKVYRRPIKSDSLLAIDFENGETIICTLEHPFYVCGKWIEARNLKVGNDCWFISSEETRSFRLKMDNPMESAESRKKVSISKIGNKNPNWTEREERVCQQCNGKFVVKRTSSRKFCSWPCAKTASVRRMTCNNPMKKLENKKFGENHPLWVKRENRLCLQCGEPFIAKETSHQKFCSLNCVGVYRMIRYDNPMKDPEIKARTLYKIRVVKPTGIERRIIGTAQSYNLPINYVGNFAFWIGDTNKKQNPDFTITGQKKVVEVYDPSFPFYEQKRDELWKRRRKQFYDDWGYQSLILAITSKTPSDEKIAFKLRNFISNGLTVTRIRRPSFYELIKSKESGELYVYNYHCKPHHNYLVRRNRREWIVLHNCWAKKRLAHRLGKGINCQLCYDFKPHFHPKRLTRIPNYPRLFVGAHCDLFGKWVQSGDIFIILEVCKQTPKDLWFFETKNPRRYHEFIEFFPENTMLSTTIETNRVYNTKIRGRTPTPDQRFDRMLDVKEQADYPLHVSIEPILDFDLEVMVEWMQLLKPFKVAVGYDSLNNRLPEPWLAETMKLIDELEKFTVVERKLLREKWDATE